MEERIAAAIRFQATPQVVPPLNLVDSFVLNQPLEDNRRRLPVDPGQRQEAAIEPRPEQVRQVGVDFGTMRMVTERAQQPPTHFHQDGRASRCHVAAPEQLLAWRFDGLLQGEQVRWRRIEPVCCGRLPHRLGIDREYLHQSIEKPLDLFLTEPLIGAEHLGGHSGTRDLPALREQRPAELDCAVDIPGPRGSDARVVGISCAKEA